MNAPLVGVLLAGGQSRRMGGGDKALRPLGDRPMLSRVIERIGSQVRCLVINANGDPSRFNAFELPVTPDPIEGFAGPLVGVLAGLRWLETSADRTVDAILTVPTDAPFLPADLAARLHDARSGHTERVVLAASGGRTHPVCGIWPLALADDLENALADGTRKVLDWTDRHDTVVVEFPMEGENGEEIDPFFNTNRPEDLTEAERLLLRL